MMIRAVLPNRPSSVGTEGDAVPQFLAHPGDAVSGRVLDEGRLGAVEVMAPRALPCLALGPPVWVQLERVLGQGGRCRLSQLTDTVGQPRDLVGARGIFDGGQMMRKNARLVAASVLFAMLAVVMPVAQAGEAPLESGTTRLSGPTRYETSVRISQETFTGPVPAVYVATGKAYPDALAGGPAAARMEAPVLLVGKDSIPDAVRAELGRLSPQTVYVLGGANAVSGAVVQELTGLAGSVVRLSGDNRYDTAVAVSEQGWTSSSSVFLASGKGFPDALGGGAAAAHKDAPLLLTDPTTLVASTRAELTRLSPSRVHVLGGKAALAESVVSEIKASLPGVDVVRLAGKDRYATSAKIAQAIWQSGSTTMFFATGMNFPDALSGTPAAHVNGAPLLLAKSTCLPGSVFDVRFGFDPSTIALLGGEAVISSATPNEKCGVDVHTGRGDDVIAIQKPGGIDNPALVAATHNGESNFIVEGLDADLEWTNTLVNEIGDYHGTTLLDYGWGYGSQPTTAQLKVSADGPWLIEVQRVSAASDMTNATTGRGDDVLAWNGSARIADFTHSGQSNFIVEAFDRDAIWLDLLVNEIGPYSGANPIPSGTRLITVKADGDWSIDLR